MALGENTGGTMYLNIKEGRIAYKDKVTKEKKTTGYVSGVITGVKFEDKEWEGNKYEQCSVTIIDGDDHYTLQMKTDSGYFRSFCNALRSGDPTKKVRLTPTYQVDGAKKISGMFVNIGNDAKALPWYSTKADPKDVPPLQAVTFKGKTVWDGTDQINYWKNWLLSIKWASEFEASAVQYEQPKQTASTPGDVAKNTSPSTESFTLGDDNEDLPF
jgi:hypothetical protein